MSAVFSYADNDSSGDREVAKLRIPPHSIEAESSVLGGLLLDNGAWDRMGDLLVDADFYRYEHKLIYGAIGTLINGSKPADVITVFEHLENLGKAGEVGGLLYLNSLAQYVPSASNIRRYAEIVRERSILRKLVTAADEISTEAFNPQGKAVDKLLDEAEQKIFNIGEEGSRSKQGFQGMDTLVLELLDRVTEMADNPADITGVPTGFIDLDRMTSGFQAGDMIVLAARPSMGKTALAINIAENVALNEGLPVAIFSMEMGASQLAVRIVGSIGRIDQTHLRTGKLTDEEWPRLTEAIEKLRTISLHIDETPGLTTSELRANSRRLARTCGQLGLIVVDYLQLMSVSTSMNDENRATAVGEISRGLKMLAKELKCPVIALSQLSRGVESRTDKRPMMSDLRESGAIEQDADVIMFIYRDDYYDKNSKEPGVAEVIISKQRNGPTGTVKLAFLKSITKFESLAMGGGGGDFLSMPSTAAVRLPQPAQFVVRGIVPTAEQAAIQIAPENTIIIEANAGAAKTTTLALRMAESWTRGVQPRDCLALTYTDEAREALALALARIGVPAAVVRQFGIETFESFSRSVLRDLDGAVVPVRPDAEALKGAVWEAIETVAGNASERWRSELVIPSMGDNATVEAFLQVDLNLKGRMLLDLGEHEGPTDPAFAASLGCDYTLLKIFKAYERIRRGGHPDHPVFRGPFDATYDLAKAILDGELPESLAAWPQRVKMVMVDEMHDMNQAMHMILSKLLGTHRFFCGVGDVDQVIYSAAGADARFLGDEIERTNARRIRRYALTASFRYDTSLARAVSRFKQKKCASASAHATAVRTQVYEDEGAQSCESLLVEEIRQAKLGRKRQPAFAVLLRHPDQSVELENALLAADIAYTTRGFDSYLMRPEILLVRGLLAVAADRFTSIDDPQTRRRVVEAFVFFCDVRISSTGQENRTQRELLEDAVRYVTDNPLILKLFFENQVLKGVTPAVAQRLRAAVQIAQTASGPQLLDRVVTALRMDLLAAGAFVQEARRAEVQGNLRGLAHSAQRFATPAEFFQSLNDAEIKQRTLRNASAGVLLADVASVKGLEFEHVALPYLKQGEFPGDRGTPLEEENLFYVGMTRARNSLSLYAHREQPSSFVARLR